MIHCANLQLRRRAGRVQTRAAIGAGAVPLSIAGSFATRDLA
jgi:hypothetical protein